MTDWFGWTALVLSVAVIAIAVSLVLFSNRNLPTVLLAVFLFTWGVFGALWHWAVGGLEAADPVGLALATIVFVLHSTAMLAFAVVYPNLALTRTKLAVILASLLVTAALVVAVATRPWTLSHLEPVYGYATLFSEIGLLVGVGFLGTRWIRAKSPAYRMQVVWGLLVFVFWSFNHAFVPLVVVPSQIGGSVVSFGHWPWIWLAVSWVALLTGALSLALVLFALRRYVKGRFDGSDRVLVLITPFLIAATTPQVYDFAFHILFDYLAAALVIYGVLRFNVVDLDLRLKWSISKGTIAAVFIATFFVASELAKVVFEGLAGNVVIGILAAGAVVLFLSPLQRAADAVADRALPRVQDSDTYRDYRRFQIYRVALEGVLQDGTVAPVEARSLQNLRAQLGISAEDHKALEEEVRAGLRPGGTP